ncbi:MAG: WG repeat-containing protein, partial [Paludibacteraceae bacterium]|nr:WG repeat-containing protein [Paludibacteraceae bacterium]
NCFPLAPYIVTSSKEDNKLNVKFLKRRGEDTGVCKIKNTETNKLIEKDFQQVDSFSDGLLRVKFNDRWYFLNDKGEGIK